ncbi:MAG: hypothetical protein IPP30_05310 [Flavobacterium sp.]|nr:hypothetical protein [Flavobacterium sp.]
MKNILGLLFLLFLLNGCDDGDLTVENIDFASVTTNSCGETIYKLNGNEAMYIKIPTSRNAFLNEITATDAPIVIPIGGDVSVTYRAYNGAPSAANICATPGPISPIATEEWTASSGNIEITSIAVYSTNETTGATTISRYAHNIVFKNIVFQKPSGTQIYESFTFGEYSTTPTTLPFNFNPDDLKLCSNNVLYNARINGIEGIAIENFDTSLLSTDNLGVTKTGLISSTSNKLSYLLFGTAITAANNDEYFCAGFPSFPPISQLWIAQDGIADVSGIIEVTTTTNGTGFLHTIVLKAVTFQKGNSTFYYGNAVLLGNLLTTN